MTRSRVLTLLCLAASALPSVTAAAQAIPAGVGSVPSIAFEPPQWSGKFNYALNASELISTGFYNSGTAYTTNLSADAAYTSNSEKHPTSAVYVGGFLLENSGQPNTVYQSLALSQGYNTKTWNFLIQDAVSYLPESPVTGLSGIPGVGDLGIDPVPLGPNAGIGILTDYGPRVSNTVTGSASHVLSGHFSVQGSGYDGIQRFIGDNSNEAVDSNNFGGAGGVTYRFNGRSALSANYIYSQFQYTGTPYSFTTQGATLDYQRNWTRQLSTDVYAGPQYIKNSDPALGQPATEFAGGATVSYAAKVAFYTLGYSRGVNNGSGVIAGSFADNIVAAAHRQFGRQWSVSGTVSYSRTTSLPSLDVYTYTSDSVAVGGQVVRGLGRRFSSYATYTVEEQTDSGTATVLNAFSGTYQVFGIGISYSPGSLFLGR